MGSFGSSYTMCNMLILSSLRFRRTYAGKETNSRFSCQNHLPRTTFALFFASEDFGTRFAVAIKGWRRCKLCPRFVLLGMGNNAVIPYLV